VLRAFPRAGSPEEKQLVADETQRLMALSFDELIAAFGPPTERASSRGATPPRGRGVATVLAQPAPDLGPAPGPAGPDHDPRVGRSRSSPGSPGGGLEPVERAARLGGDMKVPADRVAATRVRKMYLSPEEHSSSVPPAARDTRAGVVASVQFCSA